MRDSRGCGALLLDHKTLDRLKAARRLGESYTDVVIRLAKGKVARNSRGGVVTSTVFTA